MTAGGALADRVQALSPDDRAYALYWLAHGPDTSVLEDALAAVGRHRSALAETAVPPLESTVPISALQELR